jgi:hypothetical protein
MPNPSGIPFKEKMHAAVDTPAPRDEFVQDLWTRIASSAPASRATKTSSVGRMHFRPAWIGLGVVLAALVITP